MSEEDMHIISALVTQTVNAILHAQQQQPQPTIGPSSAPPRERIDERYYRKTPVFSGDNWRDWSFQFKSATRGSSGVGHDLLVWAEKEATEIEDYGDFIGEDDMATRLSGELFHIITMCVSGEALQLVQNCDFNGAEAWRKLSKRYSPTTPLRAMQLMLQIVHPGKAKTLKDVAHIVDKWETRVHMLERDFKETVSSKRKPRS